VSVALPAALGRHIAALGRLSAALDRSSAAPAHNLESMTQHAFSTLGIVTTDLKVL